MVDQLAAELPHLTTYATLSPIPGFRPWLEKRLAEEGDIILTPSERKALDALPGEGAPKSLQRLLAKNGWHRDDALAQAARAPLLRLAARYLLNEKTPAGRALDPVAHFHLSNGARVERLDWRADLSPKGLQQSYGMMINYLYRLDAIEANHEAYSGEGKVAASSTCRSSPRAEPLSPVCAGQGRYAMNPASLAAGGAASCRARGGTGRRGGLRSRCREAWGFKSLRAHQSRAASLNTAPRNEPKTPCRSPRPTPKA